jgi:hypothetical protein
VAVVRFATDDGLGARAFGHDGDASHKSILPRKHSASHRTKSPRAVLVMVLSILLLAAPFLQGNAAALALACCSGKSYDYVVNTCADTGFPDVPLRCGSQTFGPTHIAQRGHLGRIGF